MKCTRSDFQYVRLTQNFLYGTQTCYDLNASYHDMNQKFKSDQTILIHFPSFDADVPPEIQPSFDISGPNKKIRLVNIMVTS